MKLVRIDKYLADMGIGTRSEVKNYIKKGSVTINDLTIKKSDVKVMIGQDLVKFNGENIEYMQFVYYMLNKPAGVVSAVRDNLNKTVVEIITDAVKKDIFPVGRLDIDTEGLLLITNDGELAHRLLSPAKHIDKTYYVQTDKPITKDMIKIFQEGIDIGEKNKTLPAKIDLIDDNNNTAYVTIHEGKFHQIKRMFKAVGCEVRYLKRISMGILKLDEKLEIGNYRPLTQQELEKLKGDYNA